MLYLGVPVDKNRLNCIEQHSSGSFHRVKHQEDDPWSQNLHYLFDQKIKVANQMLIEKLSRPLPLEKYEYYTDV